MSGLGEALIISRSPRRRGAGGTWGTIALFASSPKYAMNMKKTDLDRLAGLKLDGQMRGAAVLARFGQGAAQLPDRKEQRRIDSAAGLVPFACKLPAELTQRLRDGAAAHAGGINGLVAELLSKSLG